MTLEQAIDSLTDEELDLLNSDPELLAAFKQKYQDSAPNWEEEYAKIASEPGLETSVLGLPVMGTDIQKIGQSTKAGVAGLAELLTGKGLEKAAGTTKAVKAGEEPSTTAGKIGEFVGGMVTPEQIALQAAGGAALEGLGVGEWAANLLEGWGENAARTAITGIKQIAKSMGLENLSALSQFLLKPVQIAGKELPAIITPLSDSKAMLSAAQAIKNAAGKVLGKISPEIDDILAQNPEKIGVKQILEALDSLNLAVKNVAPNLGKAVVNQYEAAIADFLNVVKAETLSPSPKLFTALRDLKTTIGNLVFKHGSPLESKAALEDAYGVLARGIDDAAQKAGPELGKAFSEANAIYNKAYAVVEALTGKVISEEAKGFFADIPALGAGTIAAAATHGPFGLITAPAAFLTAKAARTYGPQALAAGLNVAAPRVAPLITRGVPLAVNALTPAVRSITSGLLPD